LLAKSQISEDIIEKENSLRYLPLPCLPSSPSSSEKPSEIDELHRYRLMLFVSSV
jgi:hypothetical protein